LCRRLAGCDRTSFAGGIRPRTRCRDDAVFVRHLVVAARNRTRASGRRTSIDVLVKELADGTGARKQTGTITQEVCGAVFGVGDITRLWTVDVVKANVDLRAYDRTQHYDAAHNTAFTYLFYLFSGVRYNDNGK